MTNNTNINLDGLLPTHSDSFDTIYIFIFFVFVLATIIIKIFIMWDLERKRLIRRIENEFEQKYARQLMINNELHLNCVTNLILLSINLELVRINKYMIMFVVFSVYM